jgi:bacillithiol biosynthesis cysteine-adding enzyme BshC
MATVQEIPFRSIPHQSALFLDYLDFSPSALRFYQNAPTINNLISMARGPLAEWPFPRIEIASILRRQNEEFGCDSKTRHHIDELEKPGCVAIITGQQVGIFVSPLYTIYKALTSIHLAETLKSHGIRAVPVFWMETEDHDLPEVTHRTILDGNSKIQNVDYRDALFGKTGIPQGSVGAITFPESIREVGRDFLSQLSDSPYKPEIQHQIESSYRPGATFALAFAQMLAALLRGSGLILFDPHDAAVKRLTSAVYQKSLREADAFRAALVQRNQELQSAGFHSQVNVLENSTVLFMYEDGARQALEKRESAFALKNSHRLYDLEQLLQLAEQSPEKFSPNVLLRPLIQDTLFPTLSYVGGSAEIAYFAQIEVLYRSCGRPMPIIWPRDSFTLIEPSIAAMLDQMKLNLRDCFQNESLLIEKALRSSGLSEATLSIDELHRHLDEGLTEIKPEVQVVDPTLVRALETARRKILHNVQRLKSQAIRRETVQNSFISKAAEQLINNCYPNGVLQERQLDIHHFRARYGPSVLDEIRASLDTGSFSHHVIRLSSGGDIKG